MIDKSKIILNESINSLDKEAKSIIYVVSTIYILSILSLFIINTNTLFLDFTQNH